MNNSSKLQVGGLLAATVLALSGCGRTSTQRIVDVTKAQHLTFSSSGSTSTVILSVRGHIDGQASISAANWTPQIVSGNVDWKAGHDHFSPNIVVDYEPRNVSKGELAFELTFQ